MSLSAAVDDAVEKLSAMAAEMRAAADLAERDPLRPVTSSDARGWADRLVPEPEGLVLSREEVEALRYFNRPQEATGDHGDSEQVDAYYRARARLDALLSTEGR